MSKSILILETPKRCIECPVSFLDIKDNPSLNSMWCLVCRKEITDKNLAAPRPDWCPLYPFPEPKDVFTYNCTGKTGLDLIIECVHDTGYNDCLRDLNGGNL